MYVIRFIFMLNHVPDKTRLLRDMISLHFDYRENCANTDFDFVWQKYIFAKRNVREVFDINESDLIRIKPIKYISFFQSIRGIRCQDI